MKQPVTDLPAVMDGPGATLRTTPWGGMNCTYAELGAGTDLAPLLQGLPDDMCPCPHWGYVLRGAIRVRYTDGREEVLADVEAFYLTPGHTASIDEDSAFVEFSPEQPYAEALGHVQRKLQG